MQRIGLAILLIAACDAGSGMEESTSDSGSTGQTSEATTGGDVVPSSTSLAVTSQGVSATSDDSGPSSGASGSSSAGATTDASSGGSSGDAPTSGGPTPDYVPFYRADCDDGALGTRAEGPDALSRVIGEDPKVVYSDDQAVDDVGQSCRSWATVGGNFFGGRYLEPQEAIGDGDDIWMRHALFFPDGFCFGFGSTPSDGWGSTKWMRIEFDGSMGGSPGNRLTLQLGNFAPMGCNDQFRVYGATREYIQAANLRPPTDMLLSTGQWHMVQWQVHLATDESGFIRFWVDDEFLGQVDAATLGAPEREIAFIQYGDYWNGSPFEDVSWYVDEIIMTTQAPNTTDALGQPYIDPNTRVDDWEG